MLICCAHTSLCQKVLKLIFAKIVTYVLLSEMGSIGLVYRGLSVSLSCRTAVLYNTIFLCRRHNLWEENVYVYITSQICRRTTETLLYYIAKNFHQNNKQPARVKFNQQRICMPRR